MLLDDSMLQDSELQDSELQISSITSINTMSDIISEKVSVNADFDTNFNNWLLQSKTLWNQQEEIKKKCKKKRKRGRNVIEDEIFDNNSSNGNKRRRIVNNNNNNAAAMKVLMDIARVDTMVTVVDANNFSQYIGSAESLLEKWGSDPSQKKMIPESDERNVAHLLIDQIEFSNVIIINKCDLLDDKFDENQDMNKYIPCNKLKHISSVCSKLNPKAKIIYSSFAEVNLKDLLNSKKFSFNEAALNPGWLSEIRGEHIPETEEYGICSFVYRARKPFHPMKLHLFMMAKMMKGVYRGKGFFWIATRNDTCFDWNQAGELVDFEDGGNWFATIPEKEWTLTNQQIKEIKKDFNGKYGDRRQEIVFIGDKDKMDRKSLEEQLNFCLLTKDEMRMGPEGWKEKIDDPFELDFEDDDSEDSEDDSSDDDDDDDDSDDDSDDISDIE
eukprot:387729_1